ncbi:DEAD/DEAH box helicase family protein [Microbacterium sp. NPDC089189]|uniref:DEAD/DEAH box helicase family protein n=1 Tax=Microbacterium sp. NPDC089189 TaxID=3154972 RepID=UPI0034238D61
MAPLASWSFDGVLRHYQADVLDRVDVDGGEPLHIVAPPGSGKTLLGLLLAARRGRRTLVLAPTLTIRAQWMRAAAALAPDPARVSDDGEHPGDLTALTYQALSVLDRGMPLETIAADRWREELEADDRSPEAAAAWLEELRSNNSRAYVAGIARRSRAVRRRLVREDPGVLAAALHPRALALVERLVAAGVETIVLDECHHLLDHWALVVAALVSRLRADGRAPLVIGLTATLPSPDDAHEYDNYTALLGDVDYEVPVPAVVREGNLAPYRDLVLAVEPTAAEIAFLNGQAVGLDVLLRRTFGGDTGLAYLRETLLPDVDPPTSRDPLDPPPAAPEDAIDARLATAFSADFPAAEAAAAMLFAVAPDDPLTTRIPEVARRQPTTDEAVRLLSRFALDRVLPDAALGPLWHRIRRTLADFGYALTDRGVRRTRDPVDTMLASSRAKDIGAGDILARERAAIGDDALRALVVTDFARHGNTHGGLVGSAGALRTFDVVATHPGARGLRAVLVTGRETRVRTEDADVLVRELGRELAIPVASTPLADAPYVSAVHAPGAGAAAIVGAVSGLLQRGIVHVVVGTRGLLGEGWDCPAVNTLIDLTAVATASATQQLRGRTLRLDPAWPEKVAHNWTVTALLPATVPLDAAPDAARLRRKHAALWGLDHDDPSLVVRGLASAMTLEQRTALRDVEARRPTASVARINAALTVPERRTTHAQWRIGDDYDDHEAVSALVARRQGAPVFRTSVPAARRLGGALVGLGATALVGTALAFLGGAAWGLGVGAVLIAAAVWAGVPIAREWRRSREQSRDVGAATARIARVLWRALGEAGRVGTATGEPRVTTRVSGDGGQDVDVELVGASTADQRVAADALTELFGAVRAPRFLLEVGQGSGSGLVERLLRSAARGPSPRQYLAVPTAIGRRAADAERFAGAWRESVGACTLHAMDHPDRLGLIARARREGVEAAPSVRERWR